MDLAIFAKARCYVETRVEKRACRDGASGTRDRVPSVSVADRNEKFRPTDFSVKSSHRSSLQLLQHVGFTTAPIALVEAESPRTRWCLTCSRCTPFCVRFFCVFHVWFTFVGSPRFVTKCFRHASRALLRSFGGSSAAGVASRLTARTCLLYTSPSPRDVEETRMPSSA